MRESNYWLKVVDGINEKLDLKIEINTLLKESTELKNILGSICSKTERKDR